MATTGKMSDALNQFLDTVVDDTISDVYTLCPEFDEVPATVKGFSFFEGTSTGDDGESEKPWFSLSLHYIIDSEEAREVVGRDEVTVDAQFFINQNAVTKGLDIKGNEKLGKTLKVLGVTSAGKTSRDILEDLAGRSAIARVRHIARRKSGEDVIDEEGNTVFDARVVAISAG